MELWTEYEGRTIDGAFPLTKLLRPEGRSAFFSTSNGNGVPRVIRLIESHFDEEEILARWRTVATLNNPNVLKLEEYGQVVLDGTSLVYAVMEPVDGNLREVLNVQRLTVPETRQLAVSLVAVLEALHTHGFVHEHVEAANVFAVGEVVKLRSDCIRETPEGEEGQALKRRDVHDLAVVVLQALTQQQTLEGAAHDILLPAPFDPIVRKGMSGEWGVAEIAAALEETDSQQDAVGATSSPVVAAVPESKMAAPLPVPDRIRVPLENRPRKAISGTRWMVIAGLAVLVLFFWLGKHFLVSRSASPIRTPQPTTTPLPATDSHAISSAPASAPVPTAPAPRKADNAAGTQTQWRVVAYTYNHEDQAQHKSLTVAQRYPELHPEVFTPTGRAPYLVTIGGALSRDEAFALATKARSEGLPSDTYAQNYSGKGR
jgi:eukaryotic-like serine/threonine-protein kinase